MMLIGGSYVFPPIFLAKSQGWQNSVIVRVLICGDAPVSVKREREREKTSEDFRGERVRERETFRVCELVSKWYDIFFSEYRQEY